MKLRIVTLASALWCFPLASVHAQEGSAKGGAAPEAGVEEPEALARREFERGDAAFAAGRYEDALAAFERADSLRPNDAVRFNIAVCFDRLGRYDSAASEYRRVTQSDALPEAARERARQSLAELEARLGQLRVDAPPTALLITIDDVRCAAPCQRRVTPGLHRVQAMTPEGALERAVVVAAGQVLTVTLPTAGASSVTAAAPPATPPTASAAPLAPLPPAPDTRRRTLLGPVGYVGAGLLVLGGVGTGYFGLRTLDKQEQFRSSPSQQSYDAGVQSKLLTNVCLGTAVVGLSLLAIDQLVLK